MESKSTWLSEADRLVLSGIFAIIPGEREEDFEAARDTKKALKLKSLSEALKAQPGESQKEASDEVEEFHLQPTLHAFAVKQQKAAMNSRKVMLSSAEGLLLLRDHLGAAKDVTMEPKKAESAESTEKPAT